MKPIQAVTCCFLLLSFAGLTYAQDTFEPAQQTAATHNPAGLTCTLRTIDGRTKFHSGELIRVTLAYTADKPGQYRLYPFLDEQEPLDTFHVSPTHGVTDPLAEIRHDPVFFSGGLPEPLPVSHQPVSVTLTLNERFRFDRPGVYRVYATSSRILEGSVDPRNSPFAKGQPVVSNILSITILPPDPAWTHAKVQSALAHVGPPAEWDRDESSSLDVLRFLGTPESIRALLSVLATDRFPHSSEPTGWTCMRAFIGYSDRNWLIREMVRDLVAPDYAVTPIFLDSLSWLAEHQSHAKDIVPFQRTYWNMAADAVPQKNAAALPMTLNSLVMPDWQDEVIGPAAYVDSRMPMLTRRLAPIFDQLPPMAELSLLGDEWWRMRSAAMLPALRRLWTTAVHPENNDFSLNNLILRRLYELSPEEGRTLILQEAASPKPRVSIAALGVLPDETLPSLDATFAVNLTNNNGDFDTTGGLIARYATGDIFEQVRSFYGDASRGWACTLQAELLAYFLRVNPKFGVEMVSQALALRTKTGCYKLLFTDIAPLHFDAGIEQIAVTHLDDPDPEVVSDAAQALGQFGSRLAEAALWARLRQPDVDAKQRAVFEWRLAEALAISPKWYESPSQLQQIRALCTTDNDRRHVDEYLGNNTLSGVHIYYYLHSRDAYWNIGAYSGQGIMNFTVKMAQFPQGTIFVWHDGGFGKNEDQLYAQVQSFTKKHGMIIQHDHPAAGVKN